MDLTTATLHKVAPPVGAEEAAAAADDEAARQRRSARALRAAAAGSSGATAGSNGDGEMGALSALPPSARLYYPESAPSLREVLAGVLAAESSGGATATAPLALGDVVAGSVITDPAAPDTTLPPTSAAALMASARVGAKRDRAGAVLAQALAVDAVAPDGDWDGIAPGSARTAPAAASAAGATAASAASARYQPPLIGRLFAVGRVYDWGTGDRSVSHRVPYRCQFYIRDSSKRLAVTAWNNACVRLHEALSRQPLGALVAITGYRLRLQNGAIEASLNSDPGPKRSRVFLLSDGASARAPLHSPSRAPSSPIPRTFFSSCLP